MKIIKHFSAYKITCAMMFFLSHQTFLRSMQKEKIGTDEKNIEQLYSSALAGNKKAMLHYGSFLFWKHRTNTKEYLLGLQMMIKSGLLQIIIYKNDFSSFDAFCDYWMYHKEPGFVATLYKNVLFTANNTVLCPDQKTWDELIQEFF